MTDFEIEGAKEWLLEGDPPPKNLSNTLNRLSLIDVEEPSVRQDALPLMPQPPPPPPPQPRVRPVWTTNPVKRRVPNAHPQDTPAKAAWRAKKPFTGRANLPATYAEITQRLSKDSGKSPGEAGRALIEQIIEQTNVFIPMPFPGDSFLKVWGTIEEAREARTRINGILQAISHELRPIKKANPIPKIKAFDASKEEKISQSQTHAMILEQLRQRPGPFLGYTESLLFLWPTEDLSMEESLGSQLEVLDPLRIEFGCHIHIEDDSEQEAIRVHAYEHDTISEILNRLRAKCEELRATEAPNAKIYLAQPARSLRDCEIEITQAAAGKFAFPVLYGKPRSEVILIECDEDDHIYQRKQSHLQEVMRDSLRQLRLFKGHIQMRVNLGSFVLDEYRKVQGKPRYTLDEFRSMLVHSKCRGHMIPGLSFKHGTQDILSRIQAAEDLFSPFEATALSLKDAKPFYAVNFEFLGEDSSLLRLETEFSASPAGFLEISHKRWVKPQENTTSGDKRSPLQIAIIDFESCDWQLEVRALNFQEPSAISKALQAFSHSIKVLPNAKFDLRGDMTCRVNFSRTVPIARLVEKTALRYRLKGTTYIFEIARYDEYTPAGIAGLSQIPVTRWGGSIFDLQWDNILGQHANFQLGQTADWAPSFATFFPTRDSSNTNLEDGFTELVELIQEVSHVLSPGPKAGTVAQLPPAAEKSTTEIPDLL